MSGGMALASRVPFDCGSGGRCMQHGIDAVSSQLDLIEEALERGIPRRRLDLRSPDDHIGVSFHLATGICLAATVFFFFQVALVPRRWANSMIIAGLVTGIAWHHYMHMEDVWAASGKAPTVWRYMDWLITVPLQVVEFYTILCAANPNNDIEIKIALLLRLLMASLFMLGFGYAGEAEWIDRWVAFTLGVLCWIYIIYEISFGETAGIAGQLGVEDARRFLRHIQNRSKEQEDEENAIIKQALEEKQKQASSSGFSSIVASVTTAAKGNVNADTVAMQDMKKPEAQLAFELIRAILIFGWALYPIGYLSKGDGDNLGQSEENALNACYNLADLVNKVAFGLAIYYAASSKGEREKGVLSQQKELKELKDLGIHQESRIEPADWYKYKVAKEEALAAAASNAAWLNANKPSTPSRNKRDRDTTSPYGESSRPPMSGSAMDTDQMFAAALRGERRFFEDS